MIRESRESLIGTESRLQCKQMDFQKVVSATRSILDSASGSISVLAEPSITLFLSPSHPRDPSARHTSSKRTPLHLCTALLSP